MVSRRKFSAESKAEAVELVIYSDRAIAQVAVDMGFNEGTLGNWVRAWRDEHPDIGAKDPGPVEWAKFKALKVENAELKRKVDFLGESQRFLRCEATMNDYFEFIHAEKASFPIDWMCHRLKIARGSYYRWLPPSLPTPTQVRHGQLTEAVLRVFDREKGKAGRDQVTLILNAEGIPIAAGTVMVAGGHRAVRMRAWKKTTTADPAVRTEHIVNHMLDGDGKSDFTSMVPGIRFCGDTRYLRTGSGLL